MRKHMTSCLVVGLFLVSLPAFAIEVKQIDEDFDGDPDLVSVGTRFYEIGFNLRANGRVESLLYKPTGDELNRGRYFGYYYRLGNDYPMLKDPETGFKGGKRYLKSMTRRRVDCRVKRVNAGTAQLIFEAPGADLFEAPWMADIRTRRTVTVRDGSLVIEFNQEVTNQSNRPRPIFLCMQHGIFINKEEAYGFAPYPHGIRTVTDSPKIHGSKYHSLGDPQADWWGALKRRNGVGGVITFDGASVGRGYIHAHSHHEPGGMGFLLEHRPRILKPGQTESYPYTFMAVSGLKSLTGAVPRLVAGLAYGDQPAPGNWRPDEANMRPGMPLTCELSLLSDKARGVDVSVRVVEALTNKEIHRTQARLRVPRHKVATWSFTIPRVAASINAVFVSIGEGGKERLSFHDSFDVGKTGEHWAHRRKTRPWKGDKVEFKKTPPAVARKRPDIDFKRVTEHVPWSRPHARREAKVLFSLPYDFVEMHIRELVQRGHFAPTLVRLDRFRDLAEHAKGQQIVLLGGHALVGQAQGPVTLRQAVVDQARLGKGLVVIAPSKYRQAKETQSGPLIAMLVKAGKEVTPTFYESPHRVVPIDSWKTRFFEIGKGRVAVIDAPVQGHRDSFRMTFAQCNWRILRDAGGRTLLRIPANNGLWRGYEYAYAAMVRVMDWAGGRTAPITFGEARLRQDADDLILELPIEKHSRMTVAGTCEVTLRSIHNETLATVSRRFAFKDGGNSSQVSIRLPLGHVPAGSHAAEFRLLNFGRRVIDFGAQGVVTPDRSKLALKFDHEAEAYRAGETVTVQAKATGLADAGDYKLTYDVVDSYGRVVKKGEASFHAGNGTMITLAPWDNKSVLHDLRVSVKTAGRPVLREVATFYLFPCENPLNHDFMIEVWGPLETNNVSQRQMAARGARLAGADFTHTHGDGSGGRDIVYRTNGYAYILMGHRGLGFHKFKRDKKRGILTPSFVPTPEEEHKLKQEWQEHVRKANHVSGVFYFGMDDERQLGDEFDQSPTTLAAYRDWLKREYKTLANLNTVWQTKFAGWDQITGRQEVVRYGPNANLAPHLRFLQFMDWAWAEYYMRKPGLWAQEAVPGASVGEAGIYRIPDNPTRSLGSFYSHTNYYPGGVLEEVFRCLTPTGFEAGPYTGYRMSFDMTALKPDQRRLPWRVLFNGGHHISYWELQTSKRFQFSVLQHDGQPSIGYRVLAKEEWPDLKSGVGKLVIDREFIDSGVGFAYSRRNQLIGGGEFGVEKTIVEDLHFQHHVYDLGTEVATGALKRENVILLVLPALRCMSRAEIDAIKSFVEGGGTLLMIANRYTGEMDEHGRLHRDPTFFSRFSGVDLKSLRYITGKGDVRPKVNVKGLKGGLARPGGRALKVTSAQPLATVKIRDREIVIWTRKRQGKGAVHVLNLNLSDYVRSQAGGVAGEVITTSEGPVRLVRAAQAIFRHILREAGVYPVLRIRRNGEPLCSGESFRFEDGSGPLVFATLPRTIAAGKVQIALPAKMHTYDVRDRRYLGKTAVFEDDLRPGRAEVWAALPYKVTAVKLAAGGGVALFKPGDVVRINAQILAEGNAPIGAHTFRIDMEKKEKTTWRTLPAHSANLTAPRGAFRRTFRVAHNADPGEYRIAARDIMTDTVGEFVFRVADK